jgi:hypothetical protein
MKMGIPFRISPWRVEDGNAREALDPHADRRVFLTRGLDPRVDLAAQEPRHGNPDGGAS